jgi:holliday junction DNA helicase RuvB
LSVTSATSQERSRNPLRPERLEDIVGQATAKRLMKNACDAAYIREQPLDHTLLIGPAGTGKSTFSHAIANDLGVDVFELEAPVSQDTLLELRETMRGGDVLKIEEIHQQAIMERRGRESSTQPEVLYQLMEDRTIATVNGVLPFPLITVIGTTTDEGRLPDSFVARFPLKPRLVAYTVDEMEQIVRMNARALELTIDPAAVHVFARASRAVPREVNNLMRHGAILGAVDGNVSHQDAHEVLEMCALTTDGLNADMQAMLTQLYTKGRRVVRGEVVYQASINTIATLIGKSRDTKAVQLRVEPYLVEQGYVQVLHGGRALTDAGVVRAQELLA